MSAIIDFFRKLLSLLFGSSSTSETPAENTDQPTTETDPIETPSEDTPPQEEESTTEEPDTPEPEVEEAPEPTGPILEVTLSRYSKGTYDILGKLKVNEEECETLEAINGIPAGEYSVAFRKEGGRHATYWYKYGDIHKGMLWIKGVSNNSFPDIHIGNNYMDAQDGIVVGTQVHNGEQTDATREVWYSAQAYEKIYLPIAKHLEDGGRIMLKITE